MDIFPFITGAVLTGIFFFTRFLMKVYKIGEDDWPGDSPIAPFTPLEAPKLPQDESSIAEPVITPQYDFSTPKAAFHSTRVICDQAGLLFWEKNLICAVIWGESAFDNNAVCKNKNAKGVVTSVDVGICQINSYWHTGVGKTFPSTDYVVAHPDEAVKFMIRMYRSGKLDLWVAYKNGRYRLFLGKKM